MSPTVNMAADQTGSQTVFNGADLMWPNNNRNTDELTNKTPVV